MINHTFEDIKTILAEAGLKSTHPRMAVLKELLDRGGHPSVEQLYEAIRSDNPSISLGTVYRVLEKLVEVNLVNLVATKNGTKRYDANLKPHIHIYSANTDQIEDYHDDELNDLLTSYFEQKQVKNFRIKDIKLQINGVKDDPDESVKIV